jgi:hypothetical protein
MIFIAEFLIFFSPYHPIRIRGPLGLVANLKEDREVEVTTLDIFIELAVLKDVSWRRSVSFLSL